MQRAALHYLFAEKARRAAVRAARSTSSSSSSSSSSWGAGAAAAAAASFPAGHGNNNRSVGDDSGNNDDDGGDFDVSICVFENYRHELYDLLEDATAAAAAAAEGRAKLHCREDASGAMQVVGASVRRARNLVRA